jgi:hypothetical protein
LAFEYLAQARLRLAIILGLLASGIVLVHGTEVYTTLIGLAVLGLACWREIPVRRTSAHAVLAAALAIGLAGPYMPFLLHWAAGGGASEIRDAAVEVAGLNPAATDLFDTFGSGVGLDLPLRLALLTVGTVAALRSTGGRIVTTIGALFFLLAFAFTTMHLAVLDTIYAVTFPWGQSYRLLMLTAIAAAVLQGAGSVWIACWYARLRARARLGAALLRLATTLVAGLCIVFGAGSALSEALLLAANARVYASTTPDDAIAMAWLRSHAAPGDLVANDRYSDAGIWAPFKAGTPVVLTRLASDRLEERQLVLDDIGRLDQAAEAQSAACELDVRYVFHGSTATLWEPRHFPPLPELQQSPALDEVFSSGEATIFKTRLPCH